MRRSGEGQDPPVWAERLLRALLEPRSRDPVSGDLLEVEPARPGFADSQGEA